MADIGNVQVSRPLDGVVHGWELGIPNYHTQGHNWLIPQK